MVLCRQTVSELSMSKLFGFGEDFCRSNLRIKIPNVGSFIKEARGNHHILVYGDHSKGILALCEAFGITPVPVSC